MKEPPGHTQGEVQDLASEHRPKCRAWMRDSDRPTDPMLDILIEKMNRLRGIGKGSCVCSDSGPPGLEPYPVHPGLEEEGWRQSTWWSNGLIVCAPLGNDLDFSSEKTELVFWGIIWMAEHNSANDVAFQRKLLSSLRQNGREGMQLVDFSCESSGGRPDFNDISHNEILGCDNVVWDG